MWSQDEFGNTVFAEDLEREEEKVVGEFDFFADNNLGDDTHEQDERPNIDITPKFENLSDFGDMKISEAVNGISLKLSNNTENEFLDAEYGASYKAPINMKNHRGMAITLTGDGSGAVFLVKIGKRDYPIKVDFVGKKTVVIPHGEVAWYNGYWGWRLKSKFTKYDFTENVQISIAYLPAKTTANISLEKIIMLREEVANLSQIELKLNESRINLLSNVKITSGDIVYFDGEKANLFDKNWNFKELLNIQDCNLTALEGENIFSISHQSTDKTIFNPYYEVQLFTMGESMTPNA